MNAILRDAIRAHRVIRFMYDDQERVVEPYFYGVTRKGEDLLEGWFVSGWSSSNAAPGWRTYHVNKIRELSAIDTLFIPDRPGYTGPDNRFAEVYCHLDPVP